MAQLSIDKVLKKTFFFTNLLIKKLPESLGKHTSTGTELENIELKKYREAWSDLCCPSTKTGGGLVDVYSWYILSILL